MNSLSMKRGQKGISLNGNFNSNKSILKIIVQYFLPFLLLGIFIWNTGRQTYGNVTTTGGDVIVQQLESVPSSSSSSSPSSSFSFCERNPYMSSMKLNHEEIQNFFNIGLTKHEERAKIKPETKKDHKRFQVFEKIGNCLEETCIGGPCSSDDSKYMCGLSALINNNRHSNKTNKRQPTTTENNNNNNNNNDNGNENCVVYSVGGNNQWGFELDVLKRTTNCTTHTFDCTGPKSRFKVPHDEYGDRLQFHYECLHGGRYDSKKPNSNFLTLPEMTTKYGHKQIDLFKFDIEGYEWGVIEAMKALNEEERRLLPMQMLVEIHYAWVEVDGRMINFPEMKDSWRWKSELDIIKLTRDLMELGYVIIKQVPNPLCPACTELTLIRAYC